MAPCEGAQPAGKVSTAGPSDPAHYDSELLSCITDGDVAQNTPMQ
ncbi:MAG: hypothetical protein OXT09_08585 [Myxococcales bacterium]|nr:hypothetical protein [Myxococcales bacterium]